jgi:phenazine biosynthesis protein phzE
MAALRTLVGARLSAGRPLLAVCLSHQVLAGLLGLPVVALPSPHQGTQRRVDVFGTGVRVGFYNTFTASRADAVLPEGVEAAADPHTGEVHALRGPAFASVQFHLESLLSPDGFDLLADLTGGLLTARTTSVSCLPVHRATAGSPPTGTTPHGVPLGRP